MLNHYDARAAIVRLEAERDLELTNKHRLREIRGRMFSPFFCLSSPSNHIPVHRHWHEWIRQWYIEHHYYGH